MRHPLSRSALALLLTFSSAAAARAQQAPVPVGHVSVSSLDDLTRAATELGIPLPDLKKQTEVMPFFGPGAVVTNKPLGFIILGGDSLPPMGSPDASNDFIFAVPVVDGKSTKETLTQAGAKPLDAKSDILKLEPFNLRRIPNFLLLQMGKAIGLAEISNVPFAKDYATPGDLAVFSLDLAAIRKAAPEGYKKLFDKGLIGNDPSAQKVGEDKTIDAINSLNKLTVALATDAQAVHLKTWISPIQISGKPKDTPRPVFPKGVIAEVHLIYPNGQSTLASRIVDSIPAADFKSLTPEQTARVKPAMEHLGNRIVGGNATSVAFSMKNGKPVAYFVCQFDQEADAAKDIKADIDALNSVGSKDTTEYSTYDAGGKTISRIIGKSGTDKIIIDTLAVGKVVYTTISITEDKQVQELVDAGMSGSSSLLCAGSINVGAIFDAAGPMLPLPPDAAASLKSSLAGQGLTWTVQPSDSNFLYVDVSIPKPLVQAAAKFFVAGPPSASAPSAAPAIPATPK